MKIVDAAKIPLTERKNRHRQGRFIERRLLEGEEGSIDNFQFTLVNTGGDFFSPRHRHNFDQFRFQIEGDGGFDRDGTMTPGTVGYFPEGTRYGPQSNKGDLTVLVLQFAGASGNGYMSEAQISNASRELGQSGKFEGGVYYPNPGTGRKQQDGYEACWEHISKRPLAYPPERFHHPVFMNSNAFAWAQIEGQNGAAEKVLGNFDEYGTGIRFVKLAAGASLKAKGRRLYFSLGGKGTASAGAGGSGGWKKGDVVATGIDEAHEIRASEPAEFYVILMPQFRAAALAKAA
jgi:mannose-6-phosphate isomerase-like protein (cupin superfamily)